MFEFQEEKEKIWRVAHNMRLAIDEAAQQIRTASDLAKEEHGKLKAAREQLKEEYVVLIQARTAFESEKINLRYQIAIDREEIASLKRELESWKKAAGELERFSLKKIVAVDVDSRLHVEGENFNRDRM